MIVHAVSSSFVTSCVTDCGLPLGNGDLHVNHQYEFAGATVTKYHRLGDFNNGNSFSWFWRPEVHDQGDNRVDFS